MWSFVTGFFQCFQDSSCPTLYQYFFFFNLWLDNIALYGFFSILNREKAGILKTFAEKILKRILMLKCTKRKNSHICQVRNF